MSWGHVYEYLTRLNPKIPAVSVGLPEEHIVACERGLDLVLPGSYRGFLQAMGLGAGHYSPMGGFPKWNFYELLRDPPEEYDPKDLLRIGTNKDDHTACWSDLYIDMTTVTENGDCVILEMEWGREPCRSETLRSPRTFLEMLTTVAWQNLDAKRFEDSQIVSVHTQHSAEKEGAQDVIHRLLAQLGFSITIQPTERIQCLWIGAEPSATAQVEVDDHGLFVILAGNDGQQLKRIAQILLDNVPGACIDSNFSSLHNNS